MTPTPNGKPIALVVVWPVALPPPRGMAVGVGAPSREWSARLGRSGLELFGGLSTGAAASVSPATGDTATREQNGCVAPVSLIFVPVCQAMSAAPSPAAETEAPAAGPTTAPAYAVAAGPADAQAAVAAAGEQLAGTEAVVRAAAAVVAATHAASSAAAAS